MSQELWSAVDSYLEQLFSLDDPFLEAALEASRKAGLPEISVSPSQGQLLHVLAKMRSARAILEIGTLGGYSAIWLARALHGDGRLVTLEFDPKHAEVARENIERAGLGAVVDILVGPALDTLPHLTGPFDLVFIDADKENYPAYLTWAIKLSRSGTLIIADNVVRNGAVIEPESTDKRVQGMRQFLTELAAEPRLTTTVIQTVGAKGHDGFALALVDA